MHPLFRSRGFKLLVATGCLAGMGAQFVRRELTNPPVTANFQPPARVKEILQNSCYNCHSNETRLAWFDQVVPAIWLVADHVEKGRRHLNFSHLGGAPIAEQKAVMFECVSQIKLGAMPLKSYLLGHPGAKVTPGELLELAQYLDTLKPHVAVDADATAARDAELAKWARTGLAKNVQPAPNGIEYPADYRNWKAISSTDRADNGTMREILGNDVAVRAIQAGEINPWPDGTIFAKVAWIQEAEADGSIRAGKFKQVEFMIKDSAKYAATKGWGWARWLGTDLHPFGTSASFTSSCVSCHLPLRANDYVFTLPLKDQPGE